MTSLGTLEPFRPLAPTGSVARKVDHPCRLCELDETYHTAPQAPFREHHDMAKAKLCCSFVQVLFENCGYLKMKVLPFGEHGTTFSY